MGYERTEEIRRKQSESMKLKTTEESKRRQSEIMKIKVQEYDWVEIDRKRKETLQKTGKRAGRKKKPRLVLRCSSCESEFETIRAEQKYCNSICYDKSKVGKPVLPDLDRSTVNWNTPARREASKRRSENSDASAYRKYRGKVNRLTEKVYAENIAMINPDNLPRTLCGVEGGYQLDHKKSVKQSFLDGESPEFVARLENLQMLPWKDNLIKQ